MKNPSLVLNKVDELKFVDYEIDESLGDNEVLISNITTGICGSDIHYYAHGKIGDFVLLEGKPLVMGHESSGIVTEVGAKVTSLKRGDRVAIEPGLPSRFSDEYKSGKYNLCPHMAFAATPSKEGVENPPGTLCKYYKAPEDFLVKLPDSVSLELGALVEPLTVGVHASKLASIKFGDVVVVFGAGPVGLLAASVATMFGASKVMVVDIFDNKLQMALDIGAATHVFNSKTEGGVEKLTEKLGGGPSVVLECTGAEPCIQLGVLALKTGGRFVQVGNAPGYVKFPITEFATKELTLFGSFRYGYGDYKTSVALLDKNYRDKSKRIIDFEQLITHRFDFVDAIKAYDTVRGGNGCVKCIIKGPETAL